MGFYRIDKQFGTGKLYTISVYKTVLRHASRARPFLGRGILSRNVTTLVELGTESRSTKSYLLGKVMVRSQMHTLGLSPLV
jgi:hypothetical protein